LKVIYGLKQCPKIWYERFNTRPLKLSHKKYANDRNFYIRQVNNKTFVVLGLYVDDAMVISPYFHYLKHCKVELNEKNTMTNKRDISYCLVIQTIHDHSTKSIKLA
jgi:predicted RNA-binding protein associated with RNAse of E/G family